ncbi:MAG: putative transposase/invertase (TIGR01784 family) [Alteromonadaceae bacterium]|jgi:predicted transposase/invertase (TIGR01784 family)
MADPINPHDKFFRSSMQHAAIAQAFFRHYLPTSLRDGLDFDSIKLENSTFISDDLQETISDLVFNCRYSGDETNREAKVVLLVEHQSTPDQFMAFRVFHYLFNMLYSLLKQRTKAQTKDKLPAAYALVFYHGKPSPYPYSMDLADCFDDPLNIMHNMFKEPVHLIDVNQFEDDQLKQQQLLGIMSGALKYSRARDIGPHMIWLLQGDNSIDLSDPLTLKFVKTFFNYMVGVGNIADIELFIKNAQQLPEPVRGEVMTAAEKLRAMGAEEGRQAGHQEGRQKGLEEGKQEIAINLLKEKVDPLFIARITGFELTVILALKEQLDENDE